MSNEQNNASPIAYLTEDGERCITAKTYNTARNDGGAIWSTMRPFCVPAYATPPAAAPAPAVPQGEPFGYFRAEPFGWTDCAETDEGAIALYEAPPDVETLRKELAGANDFIKSLADVCQKYEELLGYRKTNAPEGASELAEAKGESSLNTELGLASDKSTCQHDFALDPKSSIRICLKCGTPERRAIKPTPAAPSQPVTLTDFDAIDDDVIDAAQESSGMYRVELMRAWNAIIAALREKGELR